MPMADSRCCSLCGYWHSPGSDHISPLRTYGHCASCGNEHSVGPCPQLEGPTRFPSRAEREAIHEMQQSEERARAIIDKVMIERAVREVLIESRQRLIEQAVRDVAKLDPLPLRTWDALFIAHIAGVSLDACGTCGPFLRRIRARFRELANGEGAARPAVGR